MYACSFNAVVTNLFRSTIPDLGFCKRQDLLIEENCPDFIPAWGLLFCIFISDAIADSDFINVFLTRKLADSDTDAL